jgi:tRNA (mo5U34)-methyltransferase
MHMTGDEARKKVATIPYWYHQIEVYPGVVTPGANDSSLTLKRLQIPADCSGLAVLDIGTRDGFFAFELEKRGANVTAVDMAPSTESGFEIASQLLGSRVRYFQENVYGLSSEKYGTFDIVLFLGLLYHLPDPLGALETVRRLCRGTLYLETHVLDRNGLLLPDGSFTSLGSVAPILEQIPIMQFLSDYSLGNDLSNFFAPNMRCLEEMLRSTGFTIQTKQVFESRALLRCDVAPPSAKRWQMCVSRGIPLDW